MIIIVAIYLCVLAVMSLVCFIAYGIDKQRAVRGGWRVPEKTLHTMAFFGGWPGAMLGQRQFRHKTQKRSFQIVFWLVVFLHLGIVGAVAYAIESLGITAHAPWASEDPSNGIIITPLPRRD